VQFVENGIEHWVIKSSGHFQAPQKLTAAFARQERNVRSRVRTSTLPIATVATPLLQA
jgi:hypothetical protein